MSDDYSGPRRWPWLLLALGVLLLLLLFGGHWVWSTGSGRRLAAQVALYRAAGEPIEPKDFVVTGVSDADNAAIDLRKAATGIDETTEVWKEYEKLNAALPLTEKEMAAIRAVVAANEAAFADVDTAMTKKGTDWKLAIRSPVITVLLAHLNEQRQLANLIRHRAMLSYQQGEHGAALRDLERVEFMAGAMDAQPWLVCALVATGMRAMVCEDVSVIAPDLNIGRKSGAAPPGQVKQIIAALLDNKRQRETLRRGLLGERMMQLDTARCVADGTISIAALGGGTPAVGAPMAALSVIARPIALDDGLLMIRHTTAVMKAAETSSDWPTFQRNGPPIPPQVNNRIRHMLAAQMLPAFDRAVQTMFRSTVDRRMAATALAIRMYQLDHDGALPAKLEELLPRYLPSVPLDAMASNAPVKYLARKDKPILYSVGEDGRDDGGSEASRTSRTVSSRWHRQDAVMHLTRQPREVIEEPQYAPDSIDPLPQTQPATMPSTAQIVPS
jgi:hypothetical protein